MARVGYSDGDNVGLVLVIGADVGSRLATVGAAEGTSVGIGVVGEAEGAPVEGALVCCDGDAEVSVGDTLGCAEGLCVGLAVGSSVGAVVSNRQQVAMA